LKYSDASPLIFDYAESVNYGIYRVSIDVLLIYLYFLHGFTIVKNYKCHMSLSVVAVTLAAAIKRLGAYINFGCIY